jgi:hypothetical protein
MKEDNKFKNSRRKIPQGRFIGSEVHFYQPDETHIPCRVGGQIERGLHFLPNSTFLFLYLSPTL